MLVSAVWAGEIERLIDQNRLGEALRSCQRYQTLRASDNARLMECAEVYFRTNRIAEGDKVMDKLRANYASNDYQLLKALASIKKKEYGSAQEILDKLGFFHYVGL